MRTRRLFSISTVLALALSVSASALAQKLPPNVPVVTTIADADHSIAPTLHIQSDGGGGYVHSRTVESQIQGIGDWELTTNTRTPTRGVYLSFAEPIPGTGPNGGNPIAPPDGDYFLRIIAKCHNYGNNMFSLGGGATMTCPIHPTFDDNGQSYAIIMNPVTTQYPDTEDAIITCLATDSANKCREWRIEPSGTYLTGTGEVDKGSVGKLVKVVTVKGKTVHEVQGNFYFSFAINLVKQ
jgi:hypothetical protein